MKKNLTELRKALPQLLPPRGGIQTLSNGWRAPLGSSDLSLPSSPQLHSSSFFSAQVRSHLDSWFFLVSRWQHLLFLLLESLLYWAGNACSALNIYALIPVLLASLPGTHLPKTRDLGVLPESSHSTLYTWVRQLCAYMSVSSTR